MARMAARRAGGLTMIRAVPQEPAGAQGPAAAEHLRDRARRRVRGRLLMFSDTLQRSFTALFASTVGDIVVRPEGSTTLERRPARPATVPASLVAELEQRARRRPGRRQRQRVRRLRGRQDGKVVGGSAPPAFGGNWTDAPAGHGLEGLAILEATSRTARRGGPRRAHRRDGAGYDIGDKVPIVTADPHWPCSTDAGRHRGFADGGSLNGATYAAFDTPTAQQLFLDGQDAYTDIWVTAKDGVSQDELRDAVARCCRTASRRSPATTPPRRAPASCSRRSIPHHLPADLRRDRAGGRRLPHRQHLLDPGRPAQPRAGAAARARRLATAGDPSVQLEAFVVGVLGSTLGLGLGVVLAWASARWSALIGLDLGQQPLIFAPRTVVAAYATGIVVTMVAAWLPARRTGRIAPVQALRDDVALPESSVRRRLLLGACCSSWPARRRPGGPVRLAVPHTGWWVGGGILAVLLGVDRGQPGDRPAVPARSPARPTPRSSAPWASWPGRTRCATRGVRPPPRRR